MIEPSYLALIHNGALLLSMVILFDLVIHDKNFKNKRILQISQGFILGVIGIFIMSSPWVLVPGIVFDTRSILVGISGLFFGPIPTLIVMLNFFVLYLLIGNSLTLTQ